LALKLSSYSNNLPKKVLRFYNSSPEARKWFDETKALRSFRTAQQYLESLELFCDFVDKKPSELLKLKASAVKELVKKYCIDKMSGGVGSGVMARRWRATASFFRFHDKDIGKEVPFKAKNKFLDKIPTKEELRKILDAAPSISTRIAIHLMAYAGMRPEDICDLTYASVKRDFEKNIVPCAVYVPQTKTGNFYVTFMSESTISLVGQYLDIRKKRGEEISDKSPMIIDEHTKGSRVKGIRRKTLGIRILNAMRRSGIETISTFGLAVQRMRPYSLRKYFRSNLTGHAPSEYIEAWLGHTSGLAHVYGGTKDLDPSTIERMREAYKKCEPFLLATMQPLDQTTVVKEAKIEALKSMAKALLGIDLIEVKVAKEKELGRELNRDEELDLFENELKKLREGTHNPQRIVKEDELEKHLTEGWQFISVLPSQKILIKKR